MKVLLLKRSNMEDKIMKKKENTEQKMRFIRRIISFPPFYFYSGIVISIIFYFVLPEFNLIIIPFNLIGIIFLIFGTFLIIKNTLIFKLKNTTLQLKESSCIVQDGCYKYSRNPMYLGKLIFLFGLSIVLGNIISFVNPILYFGVMNYLCIPYEEEILLETFNKEYLKYKMKVRCWL